MKQTNGSEFADQLIEGMGWPEEFRECPLLRTALEYATAWAFERWRAGYLPAEITPETFATEAVQVADNEVIGRIDLIRNWEGGPIRQKFFSAVAGAFEKTLLSDKCGNAPVDDPITEKPKSKTAKPRARATGPKAASKRARPASKRTTH